MKTVVIEDPSFQSLLLNSRANGNALSSGSGFIVQKDGRSFLLTNRHVVRGRHQETDAPLSPTGGIPDELIIRHNLTELGTWKDFSESLHDARGQARWIEHPRLGKRADVVALPLTNMQGVAVYPYDPANPGFEMTLQPTALVSVVGFPFGRSSAGGLAIWATGFVASEPELDFEGLPVFLIDCRARPGQSGSAVLAYRADGVYQSRGNITTFPGAISRFLGIYSGRINSESDIGMVWKASAIAELMTVLA